MHLYIQIDTDLTVNEVAAHSNYLYKKIHIPLLISIQILFLTYIVLIIIFTISSTIQIIEIVIANQESI